MPRKKKIEPRLEKNEAGEWVPAIRQEYIREKTGFKIPCPGQAHQFGVDQDHCGVCMPNWGEIDEYALVDLKRAQQERLDISCGDLSHTNDAEFACRIRKDLKDELVTLVSIRHGNVSYMVYRWV